MRNKQKFKPSWWPKDQPSFSMNGTRCGDITAVSVLIESLIPRSSNYINSIIRKAHSGQRRKEGYPYLIACDVEEMTGGYQDLIHGLKGYFPTWEHVSGVVLFQGRAYITKWTWAVFVIANPMALLPFPKELITFGYEKQHLIEFPFL